MRWTFFLLIFLLSPGCTSETPQIPPSAVPSLSAATSTATAGVTIEGTAQATSTVSRTPTLAVTQDCTRGDYFDEIESGGQTRQYLLHVPATYNPEEPAALVLVFHGAGISAERFVGYSRFSNVADREGFLIVYPQGQGPIEEPHWDTSPSSRDVQFVRDLLDHLQQRCHVDPNRIYASGQSNGGGMANRLACDLAARIAAVGTVSGAYSSSRCSPARPIPIFSIHGKVDKIVPYNGIPGWASAWAERNGCNPDPLDVPHNVLINEKHWTNCSEGADVVLYTIEDLGHEWTHDLINFGQTIWEFFEQHPMNATP